LRYYRQIEPKHYCVYFSREANLKFTGAQSCTNPSLVIPYQALGRGALPNLFGGAPTIELQPKIAGSSCGLPIDCHVIGLIVRFVGTIFEADA
jgi:hypothetical protein